MRSITVGEVLTHAQRAIDRLDAQYMLGHLLGRSRASLIAHPDRPLDPEHAATFQRWVGERANGRPVAQILGTREFYGRNFGIDEHVLIPRPETEILVEQALAGVSEQKCLKTATNRRLSILDLGTGSGAIAVTLKLEAPDCDVVAVERSPDALRRARANAAILNAHLTFVESDWYEALGEQRFDMIVSNPPYVAAGDPHLSKGDLRFEPTMALTDKSADGLASIRTIVSGAREHLQPGGWLLVEHGYDQAALVRELMRAAGFVDIASIADLAGVERVAACRAAGAPQSSPL
jgi:release factor glutamine methyltransferase